MTTQRMLATTLGLALVAGPVLADDTAAPEQDATAAQVKQTLKTEGHMSDKAIAALQKDIDKNSGTHGFGDAISDTVHASLAAGCTGTCLAEAIHQVNNAVAKGLSPEDSSAMVGKAVAGAKGTETQRRDHVRHEMTVALRDGSHDRMRDRSSDMGGGHGGSSMHGSGR